MHGTIRHESTRLSRDILELPTWEIYSEELFFFRTIGQNVCPCRDVCMCDRHMLVWGKQHDISYVINWVINWLLHLLKYISIHCVISLLNELNDANDTYNIKDIKCWKLRLIILFTTWMYKLRHFSNNILF